MDTSVGSKFLDWVPKKSLGENTVKGFGTCENTTSKQDQGETLERVWGLSIKDHSKH